jgi:hypothetical protein
MKHTVAALFIALMLGSTLAWGKEWCWMPPTTREGGSPYPQSEWGGYRFYCGNSRRGHFSLVVDVTDTGKRCIDIAEAKETAYCYITAYDKEGIESGPSNIHGKPIALKGATFH